MDLATCFNIHKGTAVLVPDGGAGNNGQCAQWADTVLHDVYGLPYIYTSWARTWWDDRYGLGLMDHFTEVTDGSINKGDFVIWGPLSAADEAGHIDVGSQDGGIRAEFWAYDSNWDAANFHDTDGYPTLHEVQHTGSLNDQILGVLRSNNGGIAMPTDEQIDSVIAIAHHAVFGTNAPDVDFNNLRPLLKNDFAAGVIQMLTQYNDNAAAAWKQQPAAAVPLEPGTLYRTA